MANAKANSIRIPVLLYASKGAHIVDTRALADCGASGNFVDHALVQKHRWKKEWLTKVLKARNADGTDNSGGVIRHKVTLVL